MNRNFEQTLTNKTFKNLTNNSKDEDKPLSVKVIERRKKEIEPSKEDVDTVLNLFFTLSMLNPEFDLSKLLTDDGKSLKKNCGLPAKKSKSFKVSKQNSYGNFHQKPLDKLTRNLKMC